MRRTIAVVSAGLRQPSSTRMLADRLAAAARRELEQLGAEVHVEVIELRDHAHDLVNNLLAGYPSEELKRVHQTVAGADALIAVRPTFSASYNGLIKMFVEVLDDTALVDKPVLIAATGGTGRHSQRRPQKSRSAAAVLGVDHQGPTAVDSVKAAQL
jgi:FMN reductase